jgi:CubicO group peptidase (beta-lactamase class C family)
LVFLTALVALVSTTVAYSGGLSSAVPEEVGLSALKLKHLERTMQHYIENGQLAGVVTLVARHGRIAHFKAYGKMSLETGIPMQKDTLFRLYSMTKPITSIALLKLFEKGVFQLKDHVEWHIPSFKDIKVFDGVDGDGKMKVVDQKRKVTVYDMFRHTSGLTYGVFSNSPIDIAYREAQLWYFKEPLESFIQKLAQIPLLYQPGTVWHYGYSHDVLAYLVETFSGMRFDKYLQKEIFEPLGMTDTSFGVADDKLTRYSTCYGPPGENSTGEKMVAIDKPDKSEYLLGAKFQAGGVGLVSTAADYYRFAQMLLNKGEYNGKRILGRKTVELFSANHLPPDLMPIRIGPMPMDGVGFGLGVSVVTNSAATANLGSVGQYGWSGYANTTFIIDPVEDMVSILMAQFLPTKGAVFERFKTLVYQSIIQ